MPVLFGFAEETDDRLLAPDLLLTVGVDAAYGHDRPFDMGGIGLWTHRRPFSVRGQPLAWSHSRPFDFGQSLDFRHSRPFSVVGPLRFEHARPFSILGTTPPRAGRFRRARTPLSATRITAPVSGPIVHVAQEIPAGYVICRVAIGDFRGFAVTHASGQLMVTPTPPPSTAATLLYYPAAFVTTSPVAGDVGLDCTGGGLVAGAFLPGDMVTINTLVGNIVTGGGNVVFAEYRTVASLWPGVMYLRAPLGASHPTLLGTCIVAADA